MLGDGPRDGVRFFAAEVRAREVSRRPIALLRWLVTGGRWHFVTDAQDERGHREWKAWQREWEDGLDAAWEPEEGPAVVQGSRCPSAAHQLVVDVYPSYEQRDRPAASRAAASVESRETTRAFSASLNESASGSTDDQWPDDVRMMVSQVAFGRARGWDLPSIRARLGRRDGWTAARVDDAEAATRNWGLLGEA